MASSKPYGDEVLDVPTLVRLLDTLLESYNRLPVGSVPQRQVQKLLETTVSRLDEKLAIDSTPPT